jgi:hypothetical protein
MKGRNEEDKKRERNGNKTNNTLRGREAVLKDSLNYSLDKV